MRASAARALGQLISAMPSAKRDKHASKLHVVPYLCALLLHSDQSLECEKAAVQTLQLLALCAGGIGKAMRACLGTKGVSHLVQAEPSQALSTMSPDGELLENRLQPFAVTGLGSLVLKHTHTLAITLTLMLTLFAPSLSNSKITLKLTFPLTLTLTQTRTLTLALTLTHPHAHHPLTHMHPHPHVRVECEREGGQFERWQEREHFGTLAG